MVTEFNWFSLEIIWEFDSFVYIFALLSFFLFSFFSIRPPKKYSEIPYIYIYIYVQKLDRKKERFIIEKKKKNTRYR